MHGAFRREAEAPSSGLSLIHHDIFRVLGSPHRYTRMERLCEIIQNSYRPQRVMYSHTVLGIPLPWDLCHASASCRDTVMGWVGVGKGPLGIISPDPCWKHSQLWQVAQDHVLYCVYSVSRDGDSKILGNTVQCFTILPAEKVGSFLCKSEISCISIYSHGLLSCHWILLSKAWLHPLHCLPADIHT